MRAEPKTILSFLHAYFDVLKDLFEIQSQEGIIRKEIMHTVCAKHDTDIEIKLLDYKIVRKLQDDFEIRDVYYNLFSLLLYEFKPLLPETIEKYQVSITELFRKIREGINGDKTILQERIKNLAMQVREFLEAVEKNNSRLLIETRDLKANVEKVDYRDKIKKASYWIEYYILPLNKILDINHAESIARRLMIISEFTNTRRLNFYDEGIRLQFEMLYNQLVQTNDELLRQSRILTNELLPLIERIKTESLIITGWIEFLNNPYKMEPPKLLKITRENTYSKDIYYSTKEYFEQFRQQENIVIEENSIDYDKWIYNKVYYMDRLKEQLPVENFFSWCENILKYEDPILSQEKFFALVTLLFEEELLIEFMPTDEKTKIKTSGATYLVPQIKLYYNGIS